MTTLPIGVDSPAYLEELIQRLKVRDAMTTTVVTAAPCQSLRDVQALMKAHQITGVPVVEGTRLLGIVSVDDIIQALDGGFTGDQAASRMTRQVIVLEDDMPLSFAINSMDKHRVGRFPVLNRCKELVGIITSRDVLIALLVEFNREAELREQPQPAESGPDTFTHEFRVRRYDFERAGAGTAEIKLELKRRGLDPKLIRRIAVAGYELEMNQVVHSVGGRLRGHVTPTEVEIVATDRGPGIPDVELALQEGYSTATEWIRSLGFGAGMGLANARRAADEFEISSDERGTTVRCVFRIPSAGTEQGEDAHGDE